MKTLPEKFIRGGMQYTILERSDNYYFAEVKPADSPDHKWPAYECGRIQKGKEREIRGQIIEASEFIPSDNSFGFHKSEAYFPNKFKNLCYSTFLEWKGKDEICLPESFSASRKRITLPGNDILSLTINSIKTC